MSAGRYLEPARRNRGRNRRELFKMAASGGVPERLPVPEGRYPVAPQFLPDDRHLIYTDSAAA